MGFNFTLPAPQPSKLMLTVSGRLTRARIVVKKKKAHGEAQHAKLFQWRVQLEESQTHFPQD